MATLTELVKMAILEQAASNHVLIVAAKIKGGMYLLNEPLHVDWDDIARSPSSIAMWVYMNAETVIESTTWRD